MLPYLFLSEIPVEESNRIPNKLLSAQLGIHISFWEPSKRDVISMFLNKPEFLKHKHWVGTEASGIATILNNDRFKNTVEKSTSLSHEEKDKLADLLLPEIEEAIDVQAEISLLKREISNLQNKLEQSQEAQKLDKNERQRLLSALEKSKRKVKYLKGYKGVR